MIKDLTIIGAGPAGLYASFYAGLRGLTVQIIDFQDKLGGKMNVYPEKIIWDVGGVSPKPTYELINDIIEQGLHFNPEVYLEEKVTDIIKTTDNVFEIVTDKNKYQSKTVIIAVGGGIIKPLYLNIEGAERFETKNLNYVVQSIQKFHNKNVLISGAGNTALDWAHDLSKYAKSVTLSYRKEEVSGHEYLGEMLDKLNVNKKPNTLIKELKCSDDDSFISHVVLENIKTIEEEVIEVDEVIISHGFDRESELLHKCDLNISLEDDFFIKGNGNSATNVPGIYACGDILKHPAKSHLIASCFADAANAVNLAKIYLDPDAYSDGRVSSHNDIFEEKNKEVINAYL